MSHRDFFYLHAILTLFCFFWLAFLRRLLWWRSRAFVASSVQSLIVEHVESICEQVPLGFWDCLNWNAVKIVKVWKPRAIFLKYSASDEKFSARSTVQINYREVTLKLARICQTRPRHFPRKNNPRATILFCVERDVNTNFQVAVFARSIKAIAENGFEMWNRVIHDVQGRDTKKGKNK